jgi:hypothetical protein
LLKLGRSSLSEADPGDVAVTRSRTRIAEFARTLTKAEQVIQIQAKKPMRSFGRSPGESADGLDLTVVEKPHLT